jgi:hypothetical protein
MKRKRTIKGPFVPVLLEIWDTPAWRVMDPLARLLWIELRRELRNGGLNNGKIYRSCRDAAKALGANKDTISRRYAEIEHYGFLRKTAEGFLGGDGYGIAAKYRFTDLPHGTHQPTRDYEKWDGELYTPSTTEKQNPVLSRRTPRIVPSDIRKTFGRECVCIASSDIGGTPKCIVPSDISRLATSPRSGSEGQGSLTARAPVQAGGAGSSPAPVASLTDFVLRRVNAELDRLHRS